MSEPARRKANPLLDLPGPLAGTPLARADLAQVGRWGRWVVLALLVVTVAGLFLVGAGQPADPYLSKGRIPGFDEATLRVRPAAATGAPETERCVALATTKEQIRKGLMTRTDLAGYDAMAFAFATDSTVLFYNRNVPIALTVAWFSAAGDYLGAKDLEPCPDMDGCPTVAAPTSYRYVLETKRGQLGDLGIGPGASIQVTPGCGG